MRTSVRTAIAALCATLCAGLLAACATEGGGPSGDGRASEIRAARDALGGPISDLGAAVLNLDGEVTSVRLGEPAVPDERGGEISRIREEILPEVRRALEATAAVDTEGDDPAVTAAFASWQEARAAAEELLQAAAADLDHTQLLVDADATLAEIVGDWGVPGSYSQQLERFTNLRNRARAQARDLEGVEARPSCGQSVRRRLEAARWVADSAEELRELIERRRGEEFDARRQELTAAVYGLDDVTGDPATVLARLDAGERDCWRGHGATPAAASRFEAAVEGIEDALNPSGTS